MSVYYKENPSYLDLALRSMFTQTAKPFEVVLVCDGTLTPQLDSVISQYLQTYGESLKVVRLPQNGGLANALNQGLEQCQCEYVVRMDTDDIALPHRVETQLKAMLLHHADICSATVEEFVDDPSVTHARKVVPTTNEDIRAYSKKRNPFNHPCVVYRKSKVLEVGKYESYALFEDYQLWIKMLNANCVGYNCPETLLKMRVGAGMYSRRGGWGYFKHALKLEKYKRSIGYYSMGDYVQCVAVKLVFSLVPTKLRTLLYKKVLRK
jgi:glycosyltransferase involved in cell wall biosynthesis